MFRAGGARQNAPKECRRLRRRARCEFDRRRRASARRRPKSLEPELIRARIGLEDFCMGGIDDHVDRLSAGTVFSQAGL